MFASFITLLILFFIIKYILAWINYFNKLDDRLGDSLWRWSYDYHVIGERDISDLDDKDFFIMPNISTQISSIESKGLSPEDEAKVVLPAVPKDASNAYCVAV